MTCCKRPDIANMDHVLGYVPDSVQMTNRMCLTCSRHWYGPEGAAIEYTQKERDAMFEADAVRERVEREKWMAAA